MSDSPRYRIGRSSVNVSRDRRTLSRFISPRRPYQVSEGGVHAPLPSVLPYFIFGITIALAICLPVVSLFKDGIPEAAKDFLPPSLHLPTRAIESKPKEGIHFNAGELHSEGRSLGNKTALHYVVEFTDFYCTHCQTAHKETMLPILAMPEIGAGAVRVESHPVAYISHESMRAAHAALCAQEQHKYWEVRELLFQVAIEDGESEKSDSKFNAGIMKRVASLAGLDVHAFGSCLQSGRHISEVQRIGKAARVAGVVGTPHFIFTGDKHREGVVPRNEAMALLSKRIVV